MFGMHGRALGRAVIPDLTVPDLVIPTLMVKVLPPFAAGIFPGCTYGCDHVDDQCPVAAKFRYDH